MGLVLRRMLINPQSTHDMIQGIPAADDGEAALEPRRVPRRAPGRQMDTKGAAPPSVDHIFGPRPHSPPSPTLISPLPF